MYKRQVRYRPGISATFRWPPEGSLSSFYVKLYRAGQSAPTADHLNKLAVALGNNLRCEHPSLVSRLASCDALVFAAASGTSLDTILQTGPIHRVIEATENVLTGLGELHRLQLITDRRKDVNWFSERAQSTALTIAQFSDSLGDRALKLAAALRLSLIHI